MEVNNASNTMYKCKKVILMNFTKKICKWNGTLDEYVRHVKQEHQSSYSLILNRPQKFQWKLPFVGNQIDIGILGHEYGYFLYEIYYEETSSNLCFALTLTHSFTSKKFYYQFTLGNNQTCEVFESEINMDVTNLQKSVQERPHKILINRDTFSKYINLSRELQWCLTITSNETSV